MSYYVIVLLVLVSEGQGHDVEVTAGVAWRKLPEAITYEATVPLTYRAPWIANQPWMGPPELDTCREEKMHLPECQVIDHLNKLNLEFGSEIKHWEEGFIQLKFTTEQSRNKRALDFVGDALEWCCGVATTEKFKSVSTNERQITHQINTLQSALSGTINAITETSEQFQAFHKKTWLAFNQTEERIKKLEKYLSNLGSTVAKENDLEHEILMSMLHIQFHYVHNVIRFSRQFQRQTIIATCDAHKIPKHIVSHNILLANLQKLEIELEKDHQRLSIPTSELEKYYQLQISDCSFTSRNIFLNIRVPIVSAQSMWEVFELIATPFAWKHQKCSIKKEITYLAINYSGKSPEIRQISGTSLHHCRPHTDRLCFLPRFLSDNVHGPGCAKTLFEGASLKDITQHCPIHCRSDSTITITEVDTHTFVITHPSNTTHIVCGHSSKSIPENIINQPGSIRIKLPCNCELRDKDSIIIPKRYPCGSLTTQESLYTHIIPAAWSKLQSFKFSPARKVDTATFSNLSEIFNNDWTLDIPYDNFTNNHQFLRQVKEKLTSLSQPISYVENVEAHRDTLYLIWNSLLSVVIVYLIFRGRPELMVVAATPGARADTKSSAPHHFVLLGIILTAILLFIAILMLYYIRLRKQNNKASDEKQSKENQRYHLQIEEIEEINDLEQGKRFTATLKPLLKD